MLALEFRLTVTLVLAPAAKVPLLTDNDSQATVLLADQFKLAPPELVRV